VVAGVRSRGTITGRAADGNTVRRLRDGAPRSAVLD
jgi:hypothetical protein